MLETLSVAFKKALATNSTQTSFASKIPTITEPTNDGVHDLAKNGGVAPNGIVIVPYGLGADDNAFAMRIIGWRKIGNDPLTWLWIPVVIAELTCTMSSVTGIAGRQVLNTEFFCDTLALVTGNDDVSIDIVSPTGNVVAHAVVDAKGFQKIEFSFDMTTGNPTSANCLFAVI